jgi:hypothetical protein
VGVSWITAKGSDGLCNSAAWILSNSMEMNLRTTAGLSPLRFSSRPCPSNRRKTWPC